MQLSHTDSGSAADCSAQGCRHDRPGGSGTCHRSTGCSGRNCGAGGEGHHRCSYCSTRGSYCSARGSDETYEVRPIAVA